VDLHFKNNFFATIVLWICILIFFCYNCFVDLHFKHFFCYNCFLNLHPRNNISTTIVFVNLHPRNKFAATIILWIWIIEIIFLLLLFCGFAS
jgi:hypothetical protein